MTPYLIHITPQAYISVKLNYKQYHYAKTIFTQLGVSHAVTFIVIQVVSNAHLVR